MDWFYRLTGFSEESYDVTKSRLLVRDGRLFSDASDKSYAVGELDLMKLSDLRQRRQGRDQSGRLKLELVSGNVRDMHALPRNAGALFQVASQFNLLEMMGPSMTPEHGVTGYENDHTQGPACAIAAGAATVYRNYFVPVGDQSGQTANRQLDGLKDVGAALSALTGLPVRELWEMRNGYAMAHAGGLKTIGDVIRSLPPLELDTLRGQLRVGAQYGVEVTDWPIVAGQRVSQAFCSALPLGYSRLPAADWEPFARLILEAAYEATLHCAQENAARGGSRRVYLTLLGAGAFGNPLTWVLDAMKRALRIFRDSGLDVAVVCYGEPPQELMRLAAEHEAFG